jgi:hypothetical protein
VYIVGEEEDEEHEIDTVEIEYRLFSAEEKLFCISTTLLVLVYTLM